MEVLFTPVVSGVDAEFKSLVYVPDEPIGNSFHREAGLKPTLSELSRVEERL